LFCHTTRLLLSQSSTIALALRVDFTATCDVIEVLALAPAWTIVGLTIIVLVKIGLNPLTEFQIILVFCFLKLCHINVSLDAVLVEGSLQDFIVLYKFVLVLCLPFHSVEGERIRV
jgi:hypothetical protein